MLHLILFSVFGLVCVGGAVNLLLQRHPINSALSLVVVMGALAVEFLLLGAEFVAAIQVIVYAGAVMVLSVLAGMVIVCWALLARSNAGVAAIGALPGHPAAIAQLLFHQFLLPFEVTSVLVLIAIMGAVVLAARPESVERNKREG